MAPNQKNKDRKEKKSFSKKRPNRDDPTTSNRIDLPGFLFAPSGYMYSLRPTNCFFSNMNMRPSWIAILVGSSLALPGLGVELRFKLGDEASIKTENPAAFAA